MTMDAARSLAVQLVLSPTHRVGEKCGFRIFPGSASSSFKMMMHLVHPDKCTDPRAGEAFGEMQSMKSLAVVGDPDATRQRPMTELEGLLHRALCKIRDPVETAAEVINFCDGLLRRRKRLERSVCQEALARLQWLNLNDANLEEAESVRELQRNFERRLSKALAEVQEQTEEPAEKPAEAQEETEAQEQTEAHEPARPREQTETEAQEPAEGQEETEAHGPVKEPVEEPAEQMETEAEQMETEVKEEEVEEVEEEVELPTPAQLGHYTQFKEQFTEPPEDNLKHHRLVWERSDVFTISNALQLDAVRRCPDHSLFDVLMSRTAPGLKGRIFSGIGRVPAQEAPAKKRKGSEGAVDSARAEFMKQLPPEIRQEIEMGVPDTLVGRSAFAFKKLVRYIARHRLGSVELDIKNSFFQLLNRQKPLPPIMAEYLDHREEKLAQIARVLFHTLPEARRRSVAKELMIALGFGGGFANWWLLGSTASRRRPRLYHVAVFELLPQKAKDWHMEQGRSTASGAFALYAHHERLQMEKMAAAAGRAFNDHQHDGIGALHSASEAVKRAVDVEVVVRELEDPWAYAAAKYPNLDWRLKSKMEFSGYHQLLQRCRQHVILGRARANTVDFAKLAAAKLVPVVHVPVEGGEKRTTYESFEKGGFWLVRNRDDLGQTVEDLMCKMWCPVFETVDENYVPPPPLNDNAFFTGLSSSVLGRLAGPQMADLDGDETRHKILFCDGMLYDFKERVLRSPIPANRMGFHAKATSEMWQPSKATKLFEHILAFLKEHVETGVCLLEASENGKQVIECFEELEQDGCEILRHMKVYGDWDSVLYELRLMTRAISATPRFCEMYYIWGSQDSGKDTKLKMLHAFFGHKENNYGVQLPGNYVVQQTRYLTAKDGPAPYHARTLGKRLAWASEVPEHYLLADDFIKPFCDMEVCQTTVKFTLKPSMATEERAVDGLKTRINRGEFNKYMFFLAANLVDSLEMEYNPGTEIKPQPPEMKMSAMDLVPCADKDEEAKPEAFMTGLCELVPLKEASLHTELTMALKTYLSLDTLGAAKSVISKLGIKGQSYGPRYISTLKQNERMVGVKLRSASSS
ncbi:unnamed protein product [Effrenium voratum]|uniref:Uncharacterized protein n=1 Tax=Effrenium voratum TaxID=2562239 RepID=A0AA36II88_9DINO|nr:unnamed protein product [Effrenium voratum]